MEANTTTQPLKNKFGIVMIKRTFIFWNIVTKGMVHQIFMLALTSLQHVQFILMTYLIFINTIIITHLLMELMIWSRNQDN